MKKTMLEKTIDSIEKQNQRVRQQQIRHHETIQKQIKKQIKLQKNCLIDYHKERVVSDFLVWE